MASKNSFLFFFLIFLVSINFISAKDSIVDQVYKIKLNDGNQIPAFGLGTGYEKGVPKKVQLAVESAIDAGYRHIDTAEMYRNEEQIGEAIANKIKEGVVKREDLFVTTKLWNNHHRRDLVVPTLRESLAKLKLDYVDLYLIHFPIEEFEANKTFGETDYLETWEGMEEVKNLGLAKSIGLSNFNESQIERVIKEGKIKPTALEVEVNPNFNQKKLIKFCKKKDIQVIGYSPLGSMPEAKIKPDSPPPKLDDPILTEIGKKYNKSTVQVVLRYHVQNGVIPIPRSTNPERLRNNIDIFDFKLTDEEVQKIDDFNKDLRLLKIPIWQAHKYYPFEHV